MAQEDRTELPTQRRKDEASRKGQVARSTDLAQAASLRGPEPHMKKIIVAGVAFALSSAVVIHAQDRTVLLNGEPVVVTTGAAGRGFVVTNSPAQRGVAGPAGSRLARW